MRSTCGSSFSVVPAAIALLLLLSGCDAPTPAQPTPSAPSVAPTPVPTAKPSLDPTAPAVDALAFFDDVNTGTLAADPAANGRAFIDGLAQAGFDKATMELTHDQTTIGNAADSIQFSVLWGDSCLIGQSGPAVDGYHSTVAPVLGTGKCLIGSTRPIDW